MPASDLHDPDYRDATGTMVKYLYCPECDNFSGGGVCRVCERGCGPTFNPPVPDHHRTPAPERGETITAILCSRGQGCEVVELPGLALPPTPTPAPDRDTFRRIDERIYKNTTARRFGQLRVVALMNVRNVVPKGTQGRITAKHNGMFTVQFSNGHRLAGVPYMQVGIVTDEPVAEVGR